MGYGDSLSSTNDLKGRDGIDLLARMIYSEAGNQSEEGKRACAFVAKNRKDKNASEFGGNTWEGVLLKENQFVGMTTANALRPDTSSTVWSTSLDIAKNLSSKTNPIGKCLWFNTNSLYSSRIRNVNGQGGPEQYKFPGGEYRDVVEKKVIGNHTFFRVSGY